MELIDEASVLEARLRDAALAAARRIYSVAAARQPAIDCVICGGAIPPARRVLVPGVQTCVDCQTAQEARDRQAARGHGK